MADPKIAANSNFASKVYRDEPLLFTGPQLERFTPPRIREMRRIGRGSLNEAKTFVEQARFMEAFGDEYDYQGEFVQYFPTYQHMTDAQLRGYFSWRTRVRKGSVERTSLSFAFVHIYELLNGIGASSAGEGFDALKSFWTAYRELDARIDMYLPLWLKDYVIYHNLDCSRLEGLPDIRFDSAVTVLLNHRRHGDGEVFAALNSLSSYDLAESKFFKLHPDDVARVVARVFAAVSDYYNRDPKKGAREKLFGRVCASPYSLFKAAVFHHRPSDENRVYEIGDCHRYICENGLWTCERLIWYGLNNKRIGALLKTVDYLMRRRRGYKSSLQIGKTSKALTGKIEKEIARFEEEELRNAPPKIEIDVSKLHGIRAAASATRDRLLVEEFADGGENPDDSGAANPAAPEAPVPEQGALLDEAESMFLRCLLYGGRYEDFLRERGRLPSVVMDSVNEKLFDRFGDVVVVEDGDGPMMVEDYREELKGLFPQ